MNKGALNRGDAVVIGAAVLLFVASFLDYFAQDGPGGEGFNGWSNFWFPVLPSVFLGGIIGAGLIVTSRFVGEGMRAGEYLGLRLDQWGTAMALLAFWSSFWMLFANPVGGGDYLKTGAGQILALVATIILAAGATLTHVVPALKERLIPEGGPKPAQPGAMGQPGQPPYGQPSYGQQPGGYGYPGPQSGGQPQFGQPGAQPGGQPTPQDTPDPNFQAFWFAVPQQRPLYPEDGSPTPIAELTPGTWYLAVEQRGAALVAQTQDGRRGVLQDTSDIQRG